MSLENYALLKYLIFLCEKYIYSVDDWITHRSDISLEERKNSLKVSLFLAFSAERQCVHLWHWPVWPCICLCQLNCLPDKQSLARTVCSWTFPSQEGITDMDHVAFMDRLSHRIKTLISNVYPNGYSLNLSVESRKLPCWVEVCQSSYIVQVPTSGGPGFWWKPGWGSYCDLTLGGQCASSHHSHLPTVTRIKCSA